MISNRLGTVQLYNSPKGIGGFKLLVHYHCITTCQGGGKVVVLIKNASIGKKICTLLMGSPFINLMHYEQLVNPGSRRGFKQISCLAVSVVSPSLSKRWLMLCQPAPGSRIERFSQLWQPPSHNTLWYTPLHTSLSYNAWELFVVFQTTNSFPSLCHPQTFSWALHDICSPVCSLWNPPSGTQEQAHGVINFCACVFFLQVILP